MKETLQAIEKRLQQSIRHEAGHRISCAPLIECYGARFAGIRTYDFLFDYEKAFSAFGQIKDRYPVWDIRRSLYFLHYGPYQSSIGLMRTILPDRKAELDNELQFLEQEVMLREDYQVILDQGYEAYLMLAYDRLFGAKPDQVRSARDEMVSMHQREIQDSREKNQVFLYGDHLYLPASYFSNLRSFPEFIRDVYQIPDTLKKVFRIATDHSLKISLEMVKKTGISRVMIGAPRISQEIFSKQIFENLFWPELARCGEVLIANGITPVYHLDGNWNQEMEYFRTLPKHKTIIELDGGTDIFKASQVLLDHTCLLGDVPPQLFTIGDPSEVDTYCKRLLTELGPLGGFILGSGCTLPYQAKHENVKAFFDAIEKYGGNG